MSNDTQQQSLRRSQFFHRVLTNSHSNILTFDQETLEDLWQKYDANQNGDLELDEIQAMMQGLVKNMKEEADFFNSLLESQIRWLGDSQNLVKLREKFDSNHDGKVSKEEFMAGANKLLFADLVRKYEKWQNDHEGFRGKELSKSTQSK